MFVSHSKANTELHRETLSGPDFNNNVTEVRSLRLPDDFTGTLPPALEFVHRLRREWTLMHEEPERVPLMLVRDTSAVDWRLFPGPLRPGRNDAEPREVATRRLFPGRIITPTFRTPPLTYSRGGASVIVAIRIGSR